MMGCVQQIIVSLAFQNVLLTGTEIECKRNRQDQNRDYSYDDQLTMQFSPHKATSFYFLQMLSEFYKIKQLGYPLLIITYFLYYSIFTFSK